MATFTNIMNKSATCCHSHAKHLTVEMHLALTLILFVCKRNDDMDFQYVSVAEVYSNVMRR